MKKMRCRCVQFGGRCGMKTRSQSQICVFCKTDAHKKGRKLAKKQLVNV